MLRAPSTTPPFHVLSIEGLPGSGKTRRAIEAPGRVAIQSTDRGWDGVIQPAFPDDWQERFLVGDYYMHVDLSADHLFKEGEKEEAQRLADEQAKRIRRDTWEPYKADFLSALRDETVRSIVWDFADEGYDFLRLGSFGKLERNSQLGYVGVNHEYQALIREAHKAHKNLVLVHRLAKEYKQAIDANGKEKSVETGRMKRKGPQGIEYLVHSYIRAVHTPAVVKGGVTVQEQKFEVEVLKARLNPALVGQTLELPTDWPTLMTFLAPDVDGMAWL